MNIIKAKGYDEMSKMAAAIIAAQALRKPASVFGFATGSTPVGTYRELVRLFGEGLVDFSRAVTFNLDEYAGCPASDPNSYVAFMRGNLFDKANFKASYLPDGMAPNPAAECLRYEKAITEAEGIDLQLLGIGHNGHIGFNEPDDHFAFATQHIKLTDSTIDANARFYNSRDEVPKYALSMGIGTIMNARGILMLISGADKREIAEKALHGPVTPRVPASILQMHPDVTVILAVD